jgi:hypothetical protein
MSYLNPLEYADEIQATDISYFSKYYDTNGYFSYIFGKEHYKLLSWFSQKLGGEILIDAGTCNGHSALAMAQSPSVYVASYDIEARPIAFKDDYSNIDFYIRDISTIPPELIRESSLILLDVAHDGKMEKSFFDLLIKKGFHGYLLLDDIHLNAQMEWVWDYICKNSEALDITEVGHCSGTGLVYL